MSESNSQFVPLVVGEKLYKLRCGYQAIEFVSSITKKERNLYTVIQDMQGNDFSALSLLTWACLITEQPEITKKDVYDILDSLGIVHVTKAVIEAVTNSSINQKLISANNVQAAEMLGTEAKKKKQAK